MPVTILIIDDDPAITRVLETLMKRHCPSAKVLVAADCMSALDQIRKMKVGRIRKRNLVPDIILVDARLPVIDGFQCCERLRELGAPHIVMMTAILTPDLFPKAVSAGAETVFKKSSGLKNIAQAIASMVEAIESELAHT